MRSIASRIRKDVRRFGIAKTAYEVFMTCVNLCVDFRIIKVFTKETVDPKFLESDTPIRWGFLEEDQVLALTRDPVFQQTEAFVRKALEKDDKCYAGFAGDLLASYGWYSSKPTADSNLMFHFGRDYMYHYAAYTHPKYRGTRLAVIRGHRARREFHRRGFKGVVFTIDSHNFSSLRAATASDSIFVGYFVVLKIGRHAWIHASRRCREHGFSLTTMATPPAPAIPEAEFAPTEERAS